MRIGASSEQYNAAAAHSTAGLTNTGALVETGSLAHATLSGTVNDWTPTGITAATRYIYYAGNSSATITGLTGGTDGRVITLIQTGTSSFSLASQSASSAAANRFATASGTALNLRNASNGAASVTLRYSGAALRWEVISVNSSVSVISLIPGSLSVGGNILTASTSLIKWGATADPESTMDAGISRNAAGVVEINNGTAGTLRDLTLRKLTASDRVSLTGLALTNYASSSPSGAVNDYALVDVNTQPGLRLDAGAATVISGLAISQVSGSTAVIHNVSATNSITLTHDTLSTAANRFYLPDNASVVIRPNGSAIFRYDGTSSRWRMIGSAL